MDEFMKLCFFLIFLGLTIGLFFGLGLRLVRGLWDMIFNLMKG